MYLESVIGCPPNLLLCFSNTQEKCGKLGATTNFIFLVAGPHSVGRQYVTSCTRDMAISWRMRDCLKAH